MAVISSKHRRTGGKAQKSSGKFNAVGYAKRKSRQAKTAIADVYDHTRKKDKRDRAHVSLTLDKDEKLGNGDDSEDEDIDDRRTRPRLIGENDEDVVGSDEDEEIDSDDAFEEGDEERFAGLRFSSSRNTARKAKRAGKGSNAQELQVDLREEEEESEPDDDDDAGSDEYLDVLDVLDGRAKIDDEDDAADSVHDAPKKSSEAVYKPHQTSSMAKSDEEDSEESDEDSVISASDDESEVNDDALLNLQNLVSTFKTGVKRGAEDGEAVDKPERRKKRKIPQERNEAGVEGEFGAKSSGTVKLSLEDLIAPSASNSSALRELKVSAKPLASSSKIGVLPAPLPQRSQARLDREVAYEQTKSEVDKWNDTIKRIKDAEHLSFPLQKQTIGKTSTLELAAKFKPTTQLEKSIDKLLKSGEMREEDIKRTEALKMNDLSVEEVAERRSKLRQMRELMFREEVRAKRVAKIKSKAFRKIHRKEKEKLDKALNPKNPEDDEEERMKMEIERARGRATLRHKNTSKWATTMKARAELDGFEGEDQDQRRDINDKLEREERLARRIRGEDSGEEKGDSDEEDEDIGLDGVKARAFEELQSLTHAGEASGQGDDGKPTSVFEMKFMKEAAKRQRREVDDMMTDLRKELRGGPVDSEDEAEQNDDLDAGTVNRVNGRMTFRPSQAGIRLTATQSELSDVSTLKSSENHTSPVVESVGRASPSVLSYIEVDTVPAPAHEPNPWLHLEDSSSQGIARKRNEVVLGKDSSTAVKSQNTLRKQLQKTDEERSKEAADAVVEIDAKDILPSHSTATDHPQKKRSKAKGDKSAKGKEKAIDENSEEESEVEVQERALNLPKNGLHSFEKQGALVARAFAGDNVVQDFNEAKAREVAGDAPREKDNTLPGWGSWGGLGTRKQPPKPHLIQKIAGIDPKTRADYGKAHVIISEKKDKKAAKYMVKNLPYPYTSQAQFERSMETPLGTEWNSRVAFQRATLPKVVKKMGTIIDPVQRLF